MENNIFFKNKKYNPDINNKYDNKNNERLNTNFVFSNTIYNPITGIIPKEVKNNHDLLLNINNNNNNINKLIQDKEQERKQQDLNLKVNNNNNNNIIFTNNNNNNENKTFNEIKKDSLDYLLNNNSLKYNNIYENLKDLGIIN